ncbi:hypothetical protein GHT06_005715 [Daphnia sinensis]|uniref:Uncharacterized protein n=1 Tax=Daphnia sinensis TaxID=1820382 RepID=A0AAD5PM82_9CRUS|nr:hypothetical protein GHT06_005715 [Daphnia sinensis]
MEAGDGDHDGDGPGWRRTRTATGGDNREQQQHDTEMPAEFKISSKINLTITDNGSNFLKALKMFQEKEARKERASQKEGSDEDREKTMILCKLISEISWIVVIVRRRKKAKVRWMTLQMDQTLNYTMTKSVLLFHGICVALAL